MHKTVANDTNERVRLTVSHHCFIRSDKRGVSDSLDALRESKLCLDKGTVADTHENGENPHKTYS
jgi:hypothetical protein